MWEIERDHVKEELERAIGKHFKQLPRDTYLGGSAATDLILQGTVMPTTTYDFFRCMKPEAREKAVTEKGDVDKIIFLGKSTGLIHDH